jgi:hypothetical protein
MSEWFNVLVLKTNVARVTVGSNPTLSENYYRLSVQKHKTRTFVLTNRKFFTGRRLFVDLCPFISYTKSASSSFNSI